MSILPENISPKKTPWYVTAVFIVLAIAFLVSSFRGSGWKLFQPPIITVGNVAIKADEFRKAFSLKRAYAALRGSRRPLDFRMMLNEVTVDKMVDLELTRLGIEVSYQSALESLQKNPAFLNNNGVFSQKKFETFLREAGLSIYQLVEAEKKNLAANYLRDAVCAQIQAPGPLATLVAQALFQERTGGYKVFPFSEATLNHPIPTEDDLKKLFQKDPVITPVQARYVILRISPELLAPSVDISEADVKEYHNLRDPKADYNTVRDQLKHQLQKQRAIEKVGKLLVEIDERLGAGESLSSIAQHYNLPLYELTTDQKGYEAEGMLASALVFEEYGDQGPLLREAFLQRVFQMAPDHDPELIPLPLGENMFVAVQKIIPEKKLSYEEARPYLHKKWLMQEQKKAVLAAAEAFRKKLSQKRETLSLLPPMTLTGRLNGVPVLVKEALFRLEPKHSMVISNENAAYVVELHEVTQLPPKDIPQGELRGIQEFTTKELQRLAWECYLINLKKKYPASFNTQYLNTLLQEQAPLPEED